jgi:DNA-binding IclR family transcriptional regulator
MPSLSKSRKTLLDPCSSSGTPVDYHAGGTRREWPVQSRQQGDDRLREVQSLARGLRILQLLAEQRAGIGVTDLAGEIGADKGSVSRTLQTLVKYGFAEQDPATRRYSIGPQVVSLSRGMLTRMPLWNEAGPFLRELVERTGECAHVAVLAQGKALYIGQEESPAHLRVTTGVGTMAPLHCTALGKVLLAFGDAPNATDLEAYTPRTIIDPGMLEAHLEQTRRRGYAVDDEEYMIGVRCLAAPVYDAREALVGTLGISGPVHRVNLGNLAELAEIVVDAGRRLSKHLCCGSG